MDPSDPLASTETLLSSAIDVLDEVCYNVSDENGNIPIVIDTDPEWFDASIEYVREVLEAVKDRLGASESKTE